MGRSLEQIESAAAEVMEQIEAEAARSIRLSRSITDFRAENEQPIPLGLEPLLEQANLTDGDVMEFYATQQEEAVRLADAARPLLQLTPEELEHVDNWRRELLVADAYALPRPGSRPWICVYTATSCSTLGLPQGFQGASGTCTPSYARNRFTGRCRIQGSPGATRQAMVKASWLFTIAARPAAANVRVQVTMSLHGYYILRAGPTGVAHAALTVDARGMQYGHAWGQADKLLLNVNGNTMGRYDRSLILDFLMPAGADPIIVAVGASLMTNVHGAGAGAELDFGSANGNFIDAICVNTIAT